LQQKKIILEQVLKFLVQLLGWTEKRNQNFKHLFRHPWHQHQQTNMLNRYTTYVRSHFRGLFKEGQWKKYAAFGLGVMVLDEMVGNHDLYNIDPFMSLFLGTKNIVGKERKDWKDNVAMGVGRWTAKTVMFALYLMYPITVPVILGYGALISAWRQAYRHGLVK
jgi:hypothetical protein